jgi:hypothetical protein
MRRSSIASTRIIGKGSLSGMLTEEELAHKLSELAMGRVIVRSFEDWFVQSSWNANAWASPALHDAVYSLELVLAEYSNHHVSNSYLRAVAGDLARELAASVSSVRPARVGFGMTAAELINARVSALPVLAAA